MAVHEETTPHDEQVGDSDLVLRTRSGDTEAFGELWRRHYPSGLSVARSITSSIDPDDLVQESYTRIYQAIIKGGGPNGSFRAYLFTSIRNTAAAWGRARRETAIDELDTVADPESTDQAANEALDRSLTAQAFRSLPSRWQEVLWYTEIEQLKPQEVAPLLGMKAGAVSQLAFRAREGLREAWIQAHLRSAAPGSDCQWTIEHLGAYSRGNLGTRDHKRLELHLDDCARCMIVAAEAKDVSTRLALVLLPLVLGVTGAAGYLATLQGGGAPIVALAAMPSGVPGGVFAGDGGSSGAVALGAGTGGGAAGSTGTAGGGAGITAGAGATGGVLTGMGALVGAGSAALVVAGVVAAATIIPGLAGADPATSLPSASDANSSSITSDVGPDASMNLDEPVVIDQPIDEPVEEPVEEPETPPADDTNPQVPTEHSGPVVAPPAPPVVTDPEETDPTEPEEPVDGEGPDGGEGEVPGGGGGEEPGPVLPAGSPSFTATDAFFDETALRFRYTIAVTGEADAADATVRAQVDGSAAGQTVLTLPEGSVTPSGAIDISASIDQVCRNASVDFAYVLGDQVGGATSTTLWELDSPSLLLQVVCAVFYTDGIGAVAEVVSDDTLSATTADTDADADALRAAPESPVEPAPATPVEAVTPPAEVTPAPVETAPTPVVPAPTPVETVAPPAEQAAPEQVPPVETAPAEAAPVPAEEPAAAE